MSNKVPHALVDYMMYDEGSRIIGSVKVTLPNIQAVTGTITGSGVGGPSDVPIAGLVQNMTTSVEFRAAYTGIRSILSHKYHTVEFWGAIQNVDAGTGEATISQHKVVMRIMPVSDNLGNLSPGEVQGRNIEFNVVYFKELIDGELIREIDKFNGKHEVGGVDALAAVRTAIGL